MRTLSRITTGLVVMMFVVSCSGLLKKKDEDAGAPEAGVTEVAADAAPAPAPAALASNEGDVARFPDETKLADVRATLLRTYNVREAPPNGTLVVGLNKGTAVTQLASRDKFFLIAFDDPRAPGTKLMGWVHRDAFSAVVQDAGPLVCPTGEIALFGDTPFCGKLCAVDSECPTGQACKGSANKLTAGKAGEPVQVCTVFHAHDAGAPDGGGLKKLGKSDAGTTVDAGPALPPDPGKDTVNTSGGLCPANFVHVKKTNKCHRKCTNAVMAATQCKNRPFFCIRCDGDSVTVCGESQTQCK
jgi:hypothetical protein